HLNGEEIRAVHMPAAHTDGDSVIRFVDADVIHAGDLVFYGLYPFIDGASGGSVDGVIAALRQILEMAGEGTRIIPGHGPLIGRAELAGYLEMIEIVRARVARLKAAGKSLEEVVAAQPTAEYDPEWGGGYFKPAQFVGFVYETLP
ncbi:MAG: MBL fold metallo-hydrolase, partial [Thermoanaerobaculia bacterium]|nr:MBL fold metallo-hydrolase [Thermoanaerobaculia bacterium]